MGYKQFEFLNSNYSLSSVIQQILEYINYDLPDEAPVDEVIFKAKIIITELLTNSLKHSEASNTFIHIDITDHQLSIVKTDYGKALSLVGKGSPLNRKIPITNDILHTLYAILETKNQVKFFCDENNMADILAVNDIVEHFGILIITKAANNFIYSYNEQTGENIFEATLLF